MAGEDLQPLSVPEVATDIRTMVVAGDSVWGLGSPTRGIGPFLDYPSWIYPVTADDMLVGELSWESPFGPDPDFTQVTFTPCAYYLPWYVLADGATTSVVLADFTEAGLDPSSYSGYLLYLNHRRSRIPFSMDQFVFAVDITPERVEAESSLSSLSSTCFF